MRFYLTHRLLLIVLVVAIAAALVFGGWTWCPHAA